LNVCEAGGLELNSAEQNRIAEAIRDEVERTQQAIIQIVLVEPG
jgi:hypothetical protein